MKFKWLTAPALWGGVLILTGIMFLLQNLGILPGANLLIAVGAAGLGLLFGGLFLSQREQWWAIIPAIGLLALSALMLMDIFFPGAAETWGGSVFLGLIGLSFWSIYLTHREHWWAIIPGGVLLTLAVVAGLETFIQDEAITGGIFFFGMGITFLLVAALPNPMGRMTWALIPAGVLGLLGMSMIAFTANLIPYLFALILIGAGVVMLRRAMRS